MTNQNESLKNGKDGSAHGNDSWKEMKSELIKSWSKLTDSDLEKTKGNHTEITALFQKLYGNSEDKSKGKLGDIFKRFDGMKYPDNHKSESAHTS